MPKRKIAVYASVIAGLTAIIIISLVMTTLRYSRTVLGPLNSEDPAFTGDPGYREINRLLQEIVDDETTGDLLWFGSVCEVIYESPGGGQRIDYICPYQVFSAEMELTDDPVTWQSSLGFAVCSATDGKLTDRVPDFRIEDITFTVRTPADVELTDLSFSSMDSIAVNGSSASFDFPEERKAKEGNEIYAKLGVKRSANAGDVEIADSDRLVQVNWSFVITESDRIVKDFDGVQVDVPYVLAETEPETEPESEEEPETVTETETGSDSEEG